GTNPARNQRVGWTRSGKAGHSRTAKRNQRKPPGACEDVRRGSEDAALPSARDCRSRHRQLNIFGNRFPTNRESVPDPSTNPHFIYSFPLVPDWAFSCKVQLSRGRMDSWPLMFSIQQTVQVSPRSLIGYLIAVASSIFLRASHSSESSCWQSKRV